jgi:hypothetical protein
MSTQCAGSVGEGVADGVVEGVPDGVVVVHRVVSHLTS